MPTPSGSVYLDSPRPGHDRLPARPADTERSSWANLLLTIGFVALTFGLVFAALHELANDPAPISSAFAESLADPDVRAEFEPGLVDTIVFDLIGPDFGTAAALVGVNVRATAERVTPAILADSDYQAEMTALVGAGHHQSTVNYTGEPLDFAALSAVIKRVIDDEAPELGRFVRPSAVAYTSADARMPPDLNAVMATSRQAMLVVLASLVLIVAATAIHPNRQQAISWCSRWLLVLGIIGALGVIGLPLVGDLLTGSSAVRQTLAPLATSLLIPAAVLGGIGVGCFAMASVLDSRDSRLAAEQGAAAALGVNETGGPRGQSQDEMARRGLVDASNPLTNI